MKKVSGSQILKGNTVLFATFSLWTGGKRMPTNGSVEPLRDFLVPRVKTLVLIDQPVPGSDDITYRIEVYRNHDMRHTAGRVGWWHALIRPFLLLTNQNATQIPFKIRDFLSVMDWAFRDRTRFDYFVGLESINALAGIVLRALGRVRRVVYYVSDYAPNRYANPVMNAVYLWLDRFAATHADFIWDVSSAMQPARISAGLDPKKSAPVIRVGNGLFPGQIVNPKTRDPFAIAYMGTLGPENGPDVAITALSLIRKKFPRASLHMIGGTTTSFAWLLPTIRKLGLDTAVTHYGFVPDPSDMAKIMGKCTVGVAPYRNFERSARLFGDAGKIRAYCGAGLAIVTSTVPPLGKEMEALGAAIMVSDNPKDFANAVVRVFSSEETRKGLSQNALAYATQNTWERQFMHAFEAMETI